MSRLRLLLYPFSLIYGLVTYIRNWLYDLNLLRSYEIPVKSIVIGNLSMGGTGKTPHAQYLAKLLKDELSTALLSRGYNRSTKGVIEVKPEHSALEVGDEPLLYKRNFRDEVTVVVAEKREAGVKFILNEHPETSLIILDDAFQHRAVKAGFNILLTEFKRPYFKDFVVPAGNLREWRCGKDRADVLIVTKCPEDIAPETRKKYMRKLKFGKKPVFFSRFIYGKLIPFKKEEENAKNVLLVTGIANPEPLKKFLTEKYKVESLIFPDHYSFKYEDIQKIHHKFDTFASGEKIIVTTEKDYVRLIGKLQEWGLENYPWYYQPIEVAIENKEKFNSLIHQYVRTI